MIWLQFRKKIQLTFHHNKMSGTARRGVRRSLFAVFISELAWCDFFQLPKNFSQSNCS